MARVASRGEARSAGVRAQRADLTKKVILDTARELFEARGYAATTIRLLADQAGVAVRTVYLAFGSKQGVILALIDDMSKAAGEDAAREDAQQATDGATLTHIVARVFRRFYERDFDMINALRQGAGLHPELGNAFEHGRTISRTNIGLICARIEQLGDLRSDIDVDTAAGHAHALISPDAYEELVRLRGWSHDQYEKWLARALTEAVVKLASRSA